MRCPRRRLVIWLAILPALYLVIVVVFACAQDAFVFAGAGRGDRGLPELPGLQPGELVRADGGRFRIVTVTPANARAVAVYFVGNGEDLWSAAAGASELSRYGLGVVGVEHPGYGKSAGPPTVATVLGNAEAATAHARALAQQQGLPLFAIGSSLGTFCAVHVAALGLVDRVVLRAPPTAMADAAKARFSWLPIDLLLRHRFDNLGAAPQVRCPVLVLHGDRDTIVPQRLGRQLCAAFAGPATFVDCPGYDHNDLPLAPEGPFGQRIAAFLRGG